MNDWFCLDCDAVRPLDIHGDCEKCGSSQVCVASPEIERLTASDKQLLKEMKVRL